MSTAAAAYAALTAWQHRGDVTTRDELWLAACWDAAALQLRAAGSDETAGRCEGTARRITGVHTSAKVATPPPASRKAWPAAALSKPVSGKSLRGSWTALR